MSQSLADLSLRLEFEVPAQDDSPSLEQYRTAVVDAVHAYNELRGERRLYRFSTSPGQSDYPLPLDFSHLISLEPLMQAGNVAITAGGLVPLPIGGLKEQITIAGDMMTIHPTPAYSLERRLWYRAVHVLDEETGVFPYMTAAEASVIAFKAQANAWRLVCGRVSRSEGWKYQMGDVMIDKTKVGEALTGWVSRLDGEFEIRVKRMIGTVGGLG